MIFCTYASVILLMTSNQTYGSHYGRAHSNKKQAIGRTTLDFLVKNDRGNYVHTQQNVAQRSRHGLFSQPMGLSNGDHYYDAKPDEVPKNVSVNQRMVQKVGPQLFEKMGSTNIDDLYKDKFREGQLYNKEKTDLSIHKHAFMAGGRQKLVKNSQFEHMKEFKDKEYNTTDQQGNVKVGLKNVTTNNMKKGFGNTTVGHLFSSSKYQGNPYDDQRDIDRQEKMNHKAKILKPFHGHNNPTQTFTPHYTTYHLEGQPYNQPKVDESGFRSKSNMKWNATSNNKKGLYGTFTQFPKYIEQGEKPRPQIKHQNVWKPNFNGTSKGYKETQMMPCPVPSHMPLNEIRRGKE